MKLVKTLFGVLLASALFTVTAIGATNAVTSTSPLSPDLWKMSLSGAGTIPTQGGGADVIGATFSLQRNVTVVIPSEFGVRQSIGWASEPDQNTGSWLFTTSLFND